MKEEKYLKKLYLSADVFSSCLQHAFITEKEEIMGLLIGEIDNSVSISRITASVILHRSDKQPDRVEISPEQLCLAASHAEQLTNKLGRTMKIVGWYHSHPHITVWPSHVDVRTQANYQVLDPLFVGLIFSVFQSEKGSKDNTVQVTCFQSSRSPNNSVIERREVALIIVKSQLESYNLADIINLPRVLIQEEVQLNEGEQNSGQDELTVLHNKAFKTVALVHIVSKITKPMCEAYSRRVQLTKNKIRELQTIKKQLESDYK